MFLVREVLNEDSDEVVHEVLYEVFDEVFDAVLMRFCVGLWCACDAVLMRC